MEHKNHDFYISSCLLASGLKLKRLEPSGMGKLVYFVFDDPRGVAQKIIDDHWNRRNCIPTRDVVEAINELRTRLHNGY